MPDAETVAGGAELKTRSVMLSSERLGLIAKIDLLEAADGFVTPVDYKKGKRPHTAEGAFEPERVQVCAQALVLEDNGYKVDEGMLWFAESRERVHVALDDDLRAPEPPTAHRSRERAALVRVRIAHPHDARGPRRRRLRSLPRLLPQAAPWAAGPSRST